MRNGFKFKDRHSSEFGVTVQTKSRPIRPSVKTCEVSMPHRDGSYDFSKSNSMGREMYNDRIFTVIISAVADDIYDMQTKMSKLSLWLMGNGDLIFDDMPLAVWNARVSDEILYMPERGGKKAVMEVSFRTEPFCRCSFNENGPKLEDGVYLSSSMALVIDNHYTKIIQGDPQIDAQVNVKNFGDCPMRPIIEMFSHSADVWMTLNGKGLGFWNENKGGPTIIDFEKHEITNCGEKLEAVGEFFEFPPGDNALHMRSVISNEIIMKVHFNPRFMYDVILEDVEWSDGNA